jgi:hypothetical protein
MSRRRAPIFLVALVVALTSSPARGGELEIRAAARSVGTSNALMDRSVEADLILRPALDLTYSARRWSTGYSGQLNAFALHTELLSHHHELFVFYNPAWGKDRENEVVVEASVETLRNDDQFAGINLLRPALQAKLALEPVHWFRWQTQAEASYRWFYDDPTTSSVDVLAETRVAFTLPSRTTIAPRLGYGARRFVQRSSAVNDDLDQQLDLGLRIGQGLWERAGLQLEYGYRFAIGDSGYLLRKASQEAFQYLGEDFMYGGHRGHLAFKQLFGKGWTLRVMVAAEERAYAGWPAMSDVGALTGEDRRDVRLTPSVALAYTWELPERSWAQTVKLEAEFAHIQQWSNSYWYDTMIDVGGIELRVEW